MGKQYYQNTSFSRSCS